MQGPLSPHPILVMNVAQTCEPFRRCGRALACFCSQLVGKHLPLSLVSTSSVIGMDLVALGLKSILDAEVPMESVAVIYVVHQ